MRAKLHKVVAILDGTPTGARGQSLVELTITLPILLIMLLGLTEIGWFANNYLTLLDVVREAGRYGATRDPSGWVIGEEKNYNRLDCETVANRFNKQDGEDNELPLGPSATYGYHIGPERVGGFYDGVACAVIGNLAPIEFDDNTDDIVVSVFSYRVLSQGTPSAEIRVVGRYPPRANECNGDVGAGADEFDPFDWNHNGGIDGEEFSNGEAEPVGSTDPPEWDNVRGYVFRGNHIMNLGGTLPCLGSEFTTAEVESMLNFSGVSDRTRRMEQATSYGLVLVEVFWMHHQLFALDFFKIGPMDPGQIIHVWTFFPVSGAEPDV